MSDTATVRAEALDGCPCTGRTLDRLVRPMILSLLAGEDLHGYRIVRRIAETPVFAGQAPDVTGVYRFLKSMERQGLVASTWNASRAGPARRLYRITEAGRTCLRAWAGTLEEYRRELGRLLEVVRRAAGLAATAKRACRTCRPCAGRGGRGRRRNRS